MQVWVLPTAWNIILDIAVWLLIQMGAAIFCNRLPLSFFEQSRILTRIYPFERNGRFYEQWLKVKAWKALLPDGSRLFTGGFAKKRLKGASAVYLERFIMETRRGELAHWLAMFPLPVFLLWCDLPSFLIMCLYAAAANIPCIAAQRYNRIRLRRITEKGGNYL
ncbi:glycosyl-4,4'-diaponeurosporenoate acyltransferase CrtO family protein [Paenibacillus gansuensis]|uniref:Glycosyl-4,4'-diaponeurosporenoate acyltransferase n=1 Tax=Paenibacillus gansuensis TaxID=306542 RepID=A0ABW5PCN8_9BACL